MTRTLPKLLGLAAFCGALSASPSQAATVTLDYQTDHAWGSNVWAKSATIFLDGQSHTYGAGLFRLRNESANADLLAFCIDLFQMLSLPEHYVAGTPIVTEDTKAQIGQLYNTGYDKVIDATSAAGFQLALWEIATENGGDLDLGAGRFSIGATGAQYTAAGNFLGGLTGVATASYDPLYFASSTSQDLVGLQPGSLSAAAAPIADPLIGAVAPVPTPWSVVGMVSACGALGWIGRRRRPQRPDFTVKA
ncbi:MAG: hypothetical protein AAGD04_00860 [Pseudomonadota bacterium]